MAIARAKQLPDPLRSTREIAQRYGVETREVLYAIRKGLLKGEKMGWVWVVRESELPKIWPIKNRRRE